MLGRKIVPPFNIVSLFKDEGFIIINKICKDKLISIPRNSLT